MRSSEALKAKPCRLMERSDRMPKLEPTERSEVEAEAEGCVGSPKGNLLRSNWAKLTQKLF